jgi:hypothetical protein
VRRRSVDGGTIARGWCAFRTLKHRILVAQAEELARKIIGGSKNAAKMARKRAGSMKQMD